MGSKGAKSLGSYCERQLHQKNVKLTRNDIQLWTVPYDGKI